jgi:PAS domain S-box-containing protein
MIRPMSKQSGLANLNSPLYIGILVCLVAMVSYLLDMLTSVFMLRPEMVWPLWPGCAFLVAVMLLVPRKIWPALVAAALTGFFLYDIKTDLTLRSILWYNLSDVIEVLVAALGVSYALGRLPRLNSIKRLALYSLFVVILAPISAAFVGGVVLRGNYWMMWRISFLTEALALLTVTPAILGWVNAMLARKPKSVAWYFEGMGLVTGLLIIGYFTFVVSSTTSPALLYSIVPFLLWSALRFGTNGVSTSMLIVAVFSIWGAVQQRGPFNGSTPLSNVLSLQLFLLFAAIPFMVLAALVEERKLAGETLRDSEEKFRSVFRDAGVGMIIVSSEGRFLAANRTFCDYLGYTEGELLTKTVEAITLPEDWPAFSQKLSETLTVGSSFQWVQKRCLHKSGRIVFTESSASVIRTSGDPQYLVGEVLDITKRKEAEEALSSVNRRLIESQEQERTRIARELHDDINQRMALLSTELETSVQNPPDSASDMRLVLIGVQERINDISFDLESLSHQLHSSKLEYLGIVAAIKSFCREFSATQSVEVDFEHDNIPPSVPRDVSLCVFRILQEALHNALKHSRVRHFEVRLSCSDNQLYLTVSDRGVGFDPESALNSGGLGLTSMQERVRLVNGTISIESKPMTGTTINVRVPLEPEQGSEQVAV